MCVGGWGGIFSNNLAFTVRRIGKGKAEERKEEENGIEELHF